MQLIIHSFKALCAYSDSDNKERVEYIEMKRTITSSVLLFLFLLFIHVFFTYSVISVEARKSQKHYSNKGHSQGSQSPYPAKMGTFDIMSFGAKGNGVSDDSEVICHQ